LNFVPQHALTPLTSHPGRHVRSTTTTTNLKKFPKKKAFDPQNSSLNMPLGKDEGGMVWNTFSKS